MSDYLQRLVARERLQAPTLRPRLPGRFETWAGDGRADPDGVGITETAIAAPPSVPAPVAPIARAAPARIAETPADDPAARSVFARPQAEPERGIEAARQVRAALTPAQAEARFQAIAPSVEPAPAFLPDSDTATPVPSPIATRLVSAQATQPPAAAAQAARIQSRRSVEPGPTARDETVIHVSIGRVDVRAMLPQAAGRPAAPAAPARRSLDDYLNGRGR